MGYIYKITNDINNKVYIGKTTASIEERWRWHLCAHNVKTRRTRSKLYDAMKKYGKDKFHIEAIEECSNKDLDARECYWIEKYDTLRNGYNLTLGGGGFNVIHDDEIMQILELWKQGHTQKEINEITGRYVKAIKRILYDNGVTREEIRERQSAISRALYCKPVYVYDMDGNYIAEYSSASEASKALGVHQTTIGHIVNGRDAYSNGYVFRYFKADKIEPTPYTEHPRKIEVHQYSLDGDYISSYPSYSAGARAVGLSCGNNIRESCLNKTAIAGGYQWRNYKADRIEAVEKVTKRSKKRLSATA